VRTIVALVFLSAISLWAQNTTGTILGTVKDPSGAVIPAAKVRITNENTNVSVNVLTGPSGDYVAPNLTASLYSVEAEAPGFRKTKVEHVQLLLNATARQDLRLEAGMLEQEVFVTADAPLLNSETSAIAGVVDPHAVANLPLDGRTLDALVLLTAGNTSDSSSNPRIAGSQYWGGNNYSVDGVSFNDTGNGGAAYSYSTKLTTTPSVDTVREIKVEANNAKAENEGSAAISMITKAGGNRVRTALYEYHRDRALTAKNFFATNQPKPQFNRNEFGAMVSGPLIRNRTFFSLSYEGLRERTGKPANLNLATDAIRSGNFGRTAIRDPLSGDNFPNNIIPASRIDPRSKQLLTYMPEPNIAVIGFNYVSNVINLFDVNRGSARVDHKLTGADSLFSALAYSIGEPYFVTRGTPGNYGNWSDAGYITKTGSLTWTRTLRRASINELRIAYFSHASVRLGQNLDFNPASIFPGLFQPLPLGGLPTISITGYTGISDYGGSQRAPQITIQLTDNYTFLHGRHTFKTGLDFAFIRVATNPSAGSAAFGSFAFNARYTGNGFADFLLGYPVSTARETATLVNLLYQARYSTYFQDDFKVTPRLTLNLGLRYMVQTVMQERDGSWSNFDFATGTFVIRSVNGQLAHLAIPRLLAAYPYQSSEQHGWGSDMLTGDRNNFAPRFGFAWRPFTDNKTVVRGGYGIYYAQVPAYIGIRQLSLNNSPFFLHENFEANAGTVPTLTLADPFPSGSGSVSANPAITAVNRDLRNGLSQQWNLTVERQLIRNMGLRLSYLGNKATRVPWYNYNRNLPVLQAPGTLQSERPYQPWSDITALDTNAKSFTNQMQIEINRRMANGLYLMGNFTWNKSLDNAPTVGGPQNPYNAAADRSNADGVRQQNLNLAGTYAIPVGYKRRFFNRSGALGQFISGWNLSALGLIRSGTPFSVTFTPTLAGWYATRADAIGNANVDNPTIPRWFNPAAFTIPAQYTFGNSARNLLFGPGQWKLDVGLHKDFRVSERGMLQFRAEAFNFPNHASFSNPAASLSSPGTIAKISSTSVDQRAVQFAARLSF
jgi:hypothetical protein